MTKCLVFQHPNGMVEALIAEDSPPEGMTEDDYLEWRAEAVQQPVPGAVRLPNQLIASLPDVNRRLQWRWNGTAVIIDPTVTLPPDSPSFLAAVRTDVFANDIARINTAWKLQPMWYPAVKDQDWKLVEELTKMALAANDITRAEYEGIKVVAAAHHIPVTL